MLKTSFQIAFVVIEIMLTFYSNVLQDSLMVKFLFFVVTAVLIAMGVTHIANKVLPTEKDYVPGQDRKEGV